MVLKHSESHESQSKERLIRENANTINSLLHEHIKLIASHEGDPKYDPSTFRINELIEEVNPLLWRFLELATRSVRDQLNTHLGPKKEALNTKVVRTFYIFCLLLSCTNPTQTTPLHLALTDAVEVCGGSPKLLKHLTGWEQHVQQMHMISLLQALQRCRGRKQCGMTFQVMFLQL